jgi:hypothetical protein
VKTCAGDDVNSGCLRQLQEFISIPSATTRLAIQQAFAAPGAVLDQFLQDQIVLVKYRNSLVHYRQGCNPYVVMGVGDSQLLVRNRSLNGQYRPLSVRRLRD